ncbi:hypothetical protein HGB25_01600 [Candidatus Saccharibacteria bacterium]|nr:hypothetical protein [Candidatus Saccharibacteria bacterium]
MSHANKRQNGFTIVELMLAMAFVSMLLLAIAMTVIQMSNIYNRGMTFKNVNQAGSMVANEFQRSITATKPFEIDEAQPDNRYIIQKSSGQPIGGRLCTGKYTYIWNYGKAISDSSLDPNRNVYSGKSDNIHFAKIFDSNYYYCTKLPPPVNKYPDISSEAVELLNAGQNNLVIHSLEMRSANEVVDRTTDQRLYSIRFSMGSNDQTALTSVAGEVACKVPGEPDANPLFCSVIRFDIVVRSGGSDAK